MSRPLHLFVALSSHGFGHLAQAAPVLNALRQRLPTLRLTVQCSLPAAVLRDRISGDIERVTEATDFGMVMASALDVQIGASVEAYRVFHASWESRLANQAELLARLAPDMVFADIPYLPLAAAARLGIPAVALCSLNWAAILKAYCPADPGLEAIHSTLLDAYNSATVFLCPAPSMLMPELVNSRPIGPIAIGGRNRRGELNTRLGLVGTEILVLVGLGGIELRLPVERWPAIPDMRWLVPTAWGVERPHTVSWDRVADIPFIDLLRSCDVLLTKPGYGSFAEAACNGNPVLYVERNDWPEEPGLSRWLMTHGNAIGIARSALTTGDLEEPLRALLAQPRRPALQPTGIDEAADCLARCLEAR